MEGRRWYHILMKRFSTLTLGVWAIAAFAAAAVNPQLKQVNTVYLLSMGGGMDQYLATQLTKAGLFQVVTDPQKADAILTDHVGESFETKLDQLYPAPPTPERVKNEEAKESGRRNVDMSGGGVMRVTSSSFNRGKGNFYLVDRKTRAVLWSAYEPPRDTTPNALTKTAAKVVKRLQADLTEKNAGQ